jgi:hypothetical protein
VLFEHHFERRFASLQIRNIDVDPYYSVVRRASFFDTNPSTTGQLLILNVIGSRAPQQPVAQPSLFPALRLRILAALEACAETVLEFFTRRDLGLPEGMKLLISTVP